MRALEFETDFLAMTGVSDVARFADRVVQRTPTEPDFWFGNRVIFKHPPTTAEAALAQFRADLPDAKHICIGWDVPNLAVEPVQNIFAGTDVTIEKNDVLTLSGPLERAPTPEGIDLRVFGPDDWAQSQEIALDIARDEGRPIEGYRAYLEGRAVTRQAQILAGFAQWVGAFEGDLLVGDMGVVWSARHIRYQAVQTRKSHRRRGIASALLGFVLDQAKARAPNALPVIVAEADSDAGRLYQRCGFAPAETNVNAWRAAK